MNSLTSHCFDVWVIRATKLTQLINVGYRSCRQKGCTNFIMDPLQNSHGVLPIPFMK